MNMNRAGDRLGYLRDLWYSTVGYDTWYIPRPQRLHLGAIGGVGHLVTQEEPQAEACIVVATALIASRCERP